MGSGVDVGDLAGGEWRRRGRLGSCRMEMTLDTWRLGSGDEVGDLEATLESQRLGSGEDNGNVAGGGVETKQEI